MAGLAHYGWTFIRADSWRLRSDFGVEPMVHLSAPVGKLNGVACNHYFKRSTPVTTTNVNEVTCRGCLAARLDGGTDGT